MTGDTPASTYDAPELYDLVFEWLDFDIAFWMSTAREAGGPLLDVGCGTGRVLLRLAGAGFDVEGIDNSEPMIWRLRAKASERGLTAAVSAADMRDFSLGRKFARAICAFNSFAHCETTDDQVRALECIRRHLLPGGALVMHMSYPGPKYWSEPDGEAVLEMEAVDPAGGRKIRLYDTRTKDPVAQLQRSTTEYRAIDEEGRETLLHRGRTFQRWVYRFELELLFHAAGFARSEVFGGFERQPLASPDQQMIAWAWT
jgi:SAM-dependent methyltransferase